VGIPSHHLVESGIVWLDVFDSWWAVAAATAKQFLNWDIDVLFLHATAPASSLYNAGAFLNPVANST